MKFPRIIVALLVAIGTMLVAQPAAAASKPSTAQMAPAMQGLKYHIEAKASKIRRPLVVIMLANERKTDWRVTVEDTAGRCRWIVDAVTKGRLTVRFKRVRQAKGGCPRLGKNTDITLPTGTPS